MIKYLLIIALYISTGLFLFHVKNAVMSIENSILDVFKETEEIREDLHILHAEWAYLNNRDRLETLAKKFLPGFSAFSKSQIAFIKKHKKNNIKTIDITTQKHNINKNEIADLNKVINDVMGVDE